MNQLSLDFHLSRLHHRRHQLRAVILELIAMSPTLDTSALALIETDLGDIAQGIAKLQAAQGGSTGGGFTQADLDAATAAGAESQLAADQAAFAAGLTPVQQSVAAMKASLNSSAGQTATQAPAPLSTVQASTLSLAPQALSAADLPLAAEPQGASLQVSPLSVSGSVGAAIQVNFTVSGGVAPYTFAGTPPEGLSLSATGSLTGTAARAISDQFTMLVKDNSPEPINQPVTVQVNIQ